MKKAKKKKRIKPRFFLFLLLLAGIGAGIWLWRDSSREKVPDLLTQDPAFVTADAESEPEKPAEAPVATPRPALPQGLSVKRSASADPDAFGFSTTLQVNRAERDSYSRKEPVSFGRDGEYTAVPGVLTFGSNNYRNSFAYGTVTVTDRRLYRSWETATGQTDTWTGTGWTGQPLIIQWPEEVKPFLGVADTYRTKENFTEVIYPAMDGSIYCFDLESGNRTRTISTGFIMKGTPCLDPNGWPVLYVGQSIAVQDGNLQTAYIKAYSLITNEEIGSFGKHDYFSFREWQAYDSSPLIVNDTLFYAGENGILYSSKLNTVFDASAGTVSINPEGLVKYRYKGSGYSKTNAAGSRWYGVESSISAFRDWLYFTDNGGFLQCVNANTYKLEFVQEVGEDADATPVLEESYEDNTVYVYTAGQAYTEDSGLGEGLGTTVHKKINALTGEVVWSHGYTASTGDENNSGGTIATPLVGRGNIDNLVIYAMNLVKQGDSEETGEPVLGGKLVAYDKKTGAVVWTVDTEGAADYWSSPVAVYTEENTAYLIQCDRAGNCKLYDALTGTLYYTLDLGSRIDSTPAVFGNALVVGTRGKGGSGENSKIICIKIA